MFIGDQILDHMSISIGCRNETNKDGSVKLYVRFNSKGVDKKIYTNLRVKKSNWDNKKKRLKPNHPFYEHNSKALKDLKDLVENLNIQSNYSNLSFEEAYNRIKHGSCVDSVTSYLEIHLKNQIKESTFNDYASKVKSIENNLGIKNLTFEDLSKKQNWLKLKEILKSKDRSPATFNSYYKVGKSIYSHALKDEKTYSIFPYVRYNSEINSDPKWLKTEDLQKTINDLNPNNKDFKDDAISILIYLMMFSLRGMYRKDIEKLSMDGFVNGVYSNTYQYSFGLEDIVYRHSRSKTNKVGFIYLGTYPIREIILSLNLLISDETSSLFPVFGKCIGSNFWDYYSKRFKKLTGHNFKSVRKAYHTIGAGQGIPDNDIRELLFQHDKTISKHYKNTQTPELLSIYSDYHLKIMVKYEVQHAFNNTVRKLIDYGYKELEQLLRFESIFNQSGKKTSKSDVIRKIKKVRLKNGS